VLFEILRIHNDYLLVLALREVSVNASGGRKAERTLVRLVAGGQSGSALTAVDESAIGARLSRA